MGQAESVAVVERHIEAIFAPQRRTQPGEISQRLITYVCLCRILDELTGMTHTEFELIDSFVTRWAETS